MKGNRKNRRRRKEEEDEEERREKAKQRYNEPQNEKPPARPEFIILQPKGQ